MPSDAWLSTFAEVLTRVQTATHEAGVACYIVGGALRDHRLNRRSSWLNVDLAVPHGALALARRLATVLRGAYVPLDEEAGSARVVVMSEARHVELDISDFRGASLEEDLRHRDFTINALAIRLEDWLQTPQDPHPLIDPLQGLQALQAGRLIACFSGAFHDDPVRVLRGVRFVAQLGFVLEPETITLMHQAAGLLARVSAERVRDELLMVCETDRAHDAIRLLNEVGALDVVVPELARGRGIEQGDFHHLDVLNHQLETVAQADRFLRDFAEFSDDLRQPLVDYCAQQFVERHSRKSLIKLAGLLHDVGKPDRRTVEPNGEIWFLGHEQTGAQLVAAIVERLRLSNREGAMVCQLVLHHLRPGFLSREPVLTRRAVYRFFKELGDDGPACLLTWWADRLATRGSRSRLDQIDQQRGRLEELLRTYFFQAEEVVKPPRLLDGHQLMHTFHLAPGPLIGQLLAAIEEAQAEGRVHSTEEALALARALLDHPPQTP